MHAYSMLVFLTNSSNHSDNNAQRSTIFLEFQISWYNLYQVQIGDSIKPVIDMEITTPASGN
jgi:hypothetical protein